jgi:sterol desaturase/sphingolipid hydroxylase (fatty acid hydroxylase superfamily)
MHSLHLHLLYPVTLIRNEIFLYTIQDLVKNHSYIEKERRVIPKEDYPFQFQLCVIGNTSIEVFTSYLIYQYGYDFIFYKWNDLLLLIPISFLFELFFDFFHYWTHRTIHEIPLLYKHIHKVHHKHNYPNVFTAYYQHPLDLIITNLIPTLLSFWIMKKYIYPISYLQWTWINTYKTYIEICGHSGKDIPKTSGFAQCMWLPKLLGIELYTKDHDRHHSRNNCNYSKRFKIWDKIFGTYGREDDKKKNLYQKEE